jgi:hypothetical protein
MTNQPAGPVDTDHSSCGFSRDNFDHILVRRTSDVQRTTAPIPFAKRVDCFFAFGVADLDVEARKHRIDGALVARLVNGHARSGEAQRDREIVGLPLKLCLATGPGLL